jgi:MFS family permease
VNPDITDDLDQGRFQKALTETFLSLRNRNFRLYFRGQLVSNTGNWLTNIALTLLVLNLTHSGLAVGILAACQYGPILLLSAYAGAVADRSDKRKLLIITQILEMLQSICLAVFAFLPHTPILGLYIIAIAGGLFLAFDNPLRRSFVSEMVPESDLPNAVVLYSTVVNGSRILGPLIAGALVTTVGYGWCFTLDALSYIAVLVSLFNMNPSELYRKKISTQTKGAIRAGLSYVIHTPRLCINFAMLIAIGLLTYNFNITLPIFVTKALHGNAGIYTLLYAAFSVGAVITTLFVARRVTVKMHHVTAGALLLGLATLLLSVVPNTLWALPAIFLVGAASIMYMTATTALVQLEAKANMRGRVLALQTVILIGPTALGGPVLGGLADAFGSRSPLIIGGVAAIITAILGYQAASGLTKQPAK